MSCRSWVCPLWPWARSPCSVRPNGRTGLWRPVSASFTSHSESSLQGGTVAKHSKAEAHARPQPPRNLRAQSRAADLDRLIHEPIRLGIVSALAVNDKMTFNELKGL